MILEVGIDLTNQLQFHDTFDCSISAKDKVLKQSKILKFYLSH